MVTWGWIWLYFLLFLLRRNGLRNFYCTQNSIVDILLLGFLTKWFNECSMKESVFFVIIRTGRKVLLLLKMSIVRQHSVNAPWKMQTSKSLEARSSVSTDSPKNSHLVLGALPLLLQVSVFPGATTHFYHSCGPLPSWDTSTDALGTTLTLHHMSNSFDFCCLSSGILCFEAAPKYLSILSSLLRALNYPWALLFLSSYL